MEQKRTIQCSCCGKQFIVEPAVEERTVIEKDFLHIRKQWGYFSKRDGIIHEFDVCEECYDKWLENFAIPPDNKKATELI